MRSKAIRIVLVSVGLLLAPLVAMRFTDEVDWGLGDFIVGAMLLCVVGLAYEVLAARGKTVVHRAAVGIGVGGVLLLVWSSLAVGLF